MPCLQSLLEVIPSALQHTYPTDSSSLMSHGSTYLSCDGYSNFQQQRWIESKVELTVNNLPLKKRISSLKAVLNNEEES